jgi:bacteriocin biosynthesis cyclodehydratase domain-containing protein
VAWGFTYHSALYRLINELAIEQRLPVLFGTVEGVVGRIGPYVYSPDTPCLECLITRKSANAGSQEQRLIREYRARHASRVPPLPPAHPLFVESVLRLLTIELTQLALGRYSRTLGGLVEFHYGGGSEFHSILRVPFCKVCQNSSPHRLAWDIDFTAPLVKSASI